MDVQPHLGVEAEPMVIHLRACAVRLIGSPLFVNKKSTGYRDAGSWWYTDVWFARRSAALHLRHDGFATHRLMYSGGVEPLGQLHILMW